MALSLGKLTILVGAGIAGSVLAKEGRASSVSDFFTGALKIAFRQLKNDGSATTSTNPKNNATLLQQVNSLREELQYLASKGAVTIVTAPSSGSSRYRIIVVVVVVGYGYIWWKGWKLPNLMFATRRSLSDACGNVSRKLENVYSSIAATRQHLSSRIDIVDCKVDECTDNTASTRDEVSKLLEDMRMMGADVQSVHHVVQSLESKINSIEDKQGKTMGNLTKLLNFAWSYQNWLEGASSSSSKPAPELPQVMPSRAGSLPSNLLVKPPAPSTSEGHHKPYEVSNGLETLGQSSPQTPTPSDIASNGSGFLDLNSSSGRRAATLVRRTFSASMSFKA